MPAPSQPGAANPSVRDARAAYFLELGCQPLDYERFWLELPIAGVPVTIPNPRAHGRALRLHDLHHVLTGYDTSLVGEAELSAWELAGGCGRYLAALGFDLGGTGLGALIAPRRTYAAWVRGRRSRNLFRRGYAPELLDLPLAALRTELGLVRRDCRPRLGDGLSFALAAAVGVAFLLAWPVSWLLVATSCVLPVPRA